MKNSGCVSTINLFKPISEGYDKIYKNFDNICNLMSKFSDLLDSDNSCKRSDYIKSFSYVSKSFNDLRDNFKEYYNTISENFNKLDPSQSQLTCSQNILKGLTPSGFSNSSEDTNNNSHFSININKNGSIALTPKMKGSYDKIFSEFLKIEKVTKDISNIKKDTEDKRKNRIKMLELKLQGFSDEVKHINFNHMNRQLDDLALSGQFTINTLNPQKFNVNKSSNLLIENDVNIYDGNSVKLREENQNNVLINQILNMNATKGDDMINFIESLLMKTESEVELNDTVQNLKKHK